MLALLVLIAAAAIVVVAAAAVVGHNRRFNEVERFHRASRMTSEWARSGVTTPVFASPEDPPHRRESASNGASAASSPDK